MRKNGADRPSPTYPPHLLWLWSMRSIFYFQDFQRSQTGDLLSPLLFIMVMEALNKMLIRTRELKLFRDPKVGAEKHAEEVTHLFFADDNMFICQLDERAMLNLRCILMRIQSGLSINLTKFELVRLGDEKDIDRQEKVMGCKVVKLPIKYLGLPLEANYKEVGMWNPVMARFEKTLERWKRTLLSKRGRLTHKKHTG